MLGLKVTHVDKRDSFTRISSASYLLARTNVFFNHSIDVMYYTIPGHGLAIISGCYYVPHDEPYIEFNTSVLILLVRQTDSKSFCPSMWRMKNNEIVLRLRNVQLAWIPFLYVTSLQSCAWIIQDIFSLSTFQMRFAYPTLLFKLARQFHAWLDYFTVLKLSAAACLLATNTG